MDALKKVRIVFIWMILAMVMSTSISEGRIECDPQAMKDPTNLLKLVLAGKLSNDQDIIRFYKFYGCWQDLINKIWDLTDDVRDDIRAYWSNSSRQTIINNAQNYTNELRQVLAAYTGNSSKQWPQEYQSIEATQREIEAVFMYGVNSLYDNYCPCIIGRSCSPPDMPDMFP